MRRWFLLIIVIGVIVFADQISKQLVIDNLQLYESYAPIPALSSVFQFTRTTNTGAAFGFLADAGDVFLVLAVVIIAGMLYFYRRIPQQDTLTQVAIGMVCGGAIGNVIDRVQYGHVVDFIHYRIPDLISNVSNIADHAIVLGVFIIIIANWRQDPATPAPINANAEGDDAPGV